MGCAAQDVHFLSPHILWDRMETERMEMLEPKLKALREEITNLEEEITHYDGKHQKTMEEKDDLQKQIQVILRGSC